MLILQPEQELHNVASGHREPALLQPKSWLSRRLGSCSEYSFQDHWRVDGEVEVIAELFFDTAGLGRWWPQLSGIVIENPGDTSAVARAGGTRAQGFLPYVLNLNFQVVRAEFPVEVAIAIAGDLQGLGRCQFRQDGQQVAIDMSLDVRATRPLLRFLSIVARPVLMAQHCYVMHQGELGLKRILARRPLCSEAASL
jgi:hypothetical protein